jgi:hypothetical protein
VVRFVAGRELSVGEWKRRPDCRCSPGDGNQERRGFESVLFSGEEGWVKAVARASHGDVKEPPFFHLAAFVPGANVRREMALGQEPVLGPAGLARREALVGQARQGNDLSFEAFGLVNRGRHTASKLSGEAQVNFLLGKSGSIIAYNAQFEKRILRECCDQLPNFAAWLRETEKRFVDLLNPFRSFRYYHPAQRGSASMKAVLPALLGDGYDGLEIQEGRTASLEFCRVTFGNVFEAERLRVRRDLEMYCTQDDGIRTRTTRGTGGDATVTSRP